MNFTQAAAKQTKKMFCSIAARDIIIAYVHTHTRPQFRKLFAHARRPLLSLSLTVVVVCAVCAIFASVYLQIKIMCYVCLRARACWQVDSASLAQQQAAKTSEQSLFSALRTTGWI